MMHIQQWFKLPPIFTDEELDQIIEVVDKVAIAEASVIRDGPSYKDIFSRNCKAGWLDRNETSNWIFKRIAKSITDVNDRTLKFELDHMEMLQYLEYGFGNFYNRHVDNGGDGVATRKLTAVVQLTDPKDYIGGGLTIESMAKSRHAPRERGSVAIFPSHLPHKAHPVWYGKRKALVAWMRGKKPLS